jgi:hypothetical protein
MFYRYAQNTFEGGITYLPCKRKKKKEEKNANMSL